MYRLYICIYTAHCLCLPFDLPMVMAIGDARESFERLFETKSQIFLTALNDSVLADILCEMDANVFHVEHGEITQ